MLDKEVLELFCEQMNNASIFNRAFIEKLTSVLKQSKYFENLNPILFKKTNLLTEADTFDNEISIHPEIISVSYQNSLDKYGILNDTLFTRNIYRTISLLHELTHVYQFNLEMNEIKKVYLECLKVKEGYVLMNNNIDKLIVKLLNKLNLKTQSELYVALKSYSLYMKNHDMFPIEKMADGYAYKYLIEIYHMLGKEYFKDFDSFLDTMIYHIIKDYYQEGDLVSTPYNRFLTLIKRHGYTFKDINIQNINYDIQVASYILNPTDNKINIKKLANDFLSLDIDDYLSKQGANQKDEQINLFEDTTKNVDSEKYEIGIFAYSIAKIKDITLNKLKESNAEELFYNIDMPTVEVLSDMQWNGMYVDEKELNEFGNELKQNIEKLTKDIYELAGVEFNINSTKQLGEVLFEKMQLPVIKKTKSGYSTDVDVLEKLKREDPIINKILDYRQLMKLNSTYVEGLKPYINPKTKRIHSFFHQTITATGRISSTEPNLQNIPTRFELGKRVRKVFKPEQGKIYIDADYSQIELRVLAHFSDDNHMVNAFINDEDIHKQAASKVFKTPIDEVTKEQRSNAKAVNFGIVYGISDFGLGEQLGISRKKAKQYIDEYLEEYSGIKKFMENIIEKAKEQGYVETLFHRRRYIPELNSKNYMVRQFGNRVAMNTPIQGTAADIMKIAMINVYKELKKRNLESKIVLQVHDEMMIEADISETEQIKQIIKEKMETAVKLKVPLIVEVSEANNWYDCK